MFVITGDAANDFLYTYKQYFDSVNAKVITVNKITDFQESFEKIFGFLSESTTNNENTSEDDLTKTIDNIERIKSSYQIGKTAEEEIFELLKFTFPKYVVEDTSKLSHSGDIHMHDLKNNILYMFEIKNKLTITAEDINKFERDIKTLYKTYKRVIGVLISLKCDIPIYGELSIQNDKVYITEKYINSECLKIIIDSYESILKQKKKNKNKIDYIISENIYTLLAKLNLEYHDIMENKEIYEKQIEFNNTSTANMTKLINSLNVRQEFITFIRKEFCKEDMIDENEKQQVENDLEIIRLSQYLTSMTKSKITKSSLLSEFPKLKNLIQKTKLEELISKYRN